MATLAGKRSITKNKTEQKINLRTLLGRKPTNEEKTLFAELSIELINNRTLDGKDINNKKFTKYSKKYAELKGVPRSAVDLFLDGDMLDAIDTTGSTRDTVSIGIVGGVDALKSDNHNKGVTLPKREFFGVTKKEADRIANTIKSDTVEATEVSGFSLAELRAALELLDIEQIE